MRPFIKSTRSGFTLLELLVVLGIIGILLGMLLPAVSSVREVARRTTCINNIKQLTISVLNYESAYQRFPQATGVVLRKDRDLPDTTDRYSGFLSIFHYGGRYMGPYYDEEVEHQGVSYPAYPDVQTAGHPLWSEERPSHLCPSLPIADSKFGSVHYAFSIGDAAKNVHDAKSIRGAFAVGQAQTLDGITDGTSNTIGLVEIGGFSDRSAGRRIAINQPTKYLENPSLASELVDRSNKYKSSVELSPSRRGGNWADGTGGPGLVNTILPPGSPTLLIGGESSVDGFFSASVNHPGGTVVAFCDGSTHFIASDVDVGNQEHPTKSAEELFGTESQYGVWGALGSANGAESVAGTY